MFLLVFERVLLNLYHPVHTKIVTDFNDEFHDVNKRNHSDDDGKSKFL